MTRSGDQVSVARADGDGYPEYARERFDLVVHGEADVSFEG